MGGNQLGIHRYLLSFGLLVLGSVGGLQARSQFNACPEAGLNAKDSIGNLTKLVVQTPALKYTVTNFDPSWFDTDNPENSPTLFTLTILPGFVPSIPDNISNAIRLRVQVMADTTLGRDPGSAFNAFDRITAPLDGSKIGLTLRSQEVFALPFESGGVTFQNSALYDIILDKRAAPEMNLIFKFNLTCEDNTIIAANTSTIELGDIGKLRYVKTIQALYPGTQITSPKPVPIYTLTPIFKVASELFNANVFSYPPGESKIEVFLYELPSGVLPSDALDGLEYAKFGIDKDSPTPYPPNQPRLQPGVKYVWRARALLRGPTSDYLYSNPLYFKLDERLEGGSSIPPSEISDLKSMDQQVKFGDDYSKRVMAALKIILTDNYEIFELSRNGKIPAKGQIRLNGHPYSLDELERLAREFHQSRHSLTRLRFQ
jgi:hypothetical protein